MTVNKIVSIALASAIAFSPAVVHASDDGFGQETVTRSASSELAAYPLAQGRALQAIAILETELAEHPHDPALLINLGIAHAQRGDEATAREIFETAMKSPEAIDLETANGSLMDSRRLARRAIAMLERGEFRQRRDVISMRN